MSLGCASGLSHFWNSRPVNIFISSPVYRIKGHPCFKHSNILRVCLAAPYVTGTFWISMWHWWGSGAKQTTKTCKHINYWPRTLFKVSETFLLPLGQLLPWPHNMNESVCDLFHFKEWLERVLFRHFLWPCSCLQPSKLNMNQLHLYVIW